MHDSTAPDWLDELLRTAESKAAKQQPLDARALRTIGLSKQQIGRWFTKRFQFSFDAYWQMQQLAYELGTTCFRDSEAEFKTGRKPRFQKLLTENQIDVTNSSDETKLIVNRILSPIGPMVVVANPQGICLLDFADGRLLESHIVRVAKLYGTQFRTGVNAHIVHLAAELKEYFAGQRTQFSVPLEDRGTDFQHLVWQQLKQLSFGATRIYSEIATAIGRSSAVRAVGRANGDNRLAILIPCHRLLGSEGSLTGYGGGLQRKQWLLDHESRSGNPT